MRACDLCHEALVDSDPTRTVLTTAKPTDNPLDICEFCQEKLICTVDAENLMRAVCSILYKAIEKNDAP